MSENSFHPTAPVGRTPRTAPGRTGGHNGPAVGGGSLPPTHIPSAGTPADRIVTPGELLRTASTERLAADAHLWGLGGLHGGLALAALAGVMRRGTGNGRLRQATGRFVRPIVNEASIETETLRSGSATQMFTARASRDNQVVVLADAIFGDGRGCLPAAAPAAPAAGSPLDHATFDLPAELVPISRYLEIRPVGSTRPFAGGDLAELTAWVRFVEDDDPPDELRLIVLMDALPAAVTASMTEIVEIPTVELTVRPGPESTRTSSPWVLLVARSHFATAEGWADERIDAWAPDGCHLGVAHQLRARSRPPRNVAGPSGTTEPTASIPATESTQLQGATSS